MTFTAWTNGDKGFGFKISIKDRDTFFSKDNQTVNIQLPYNNSYKTICCNTQKASFWNKTCKELINSEIGKWLKENKYFPWEKGNPPKFEAEKINTNTYKIITRAN